MLIIVIVIIGVVFQFTTGGMFLSSRNLGTLFLQFSVVGYLTIGVVFVMVTRGIDLSIASVIALITAIGAVLGAILLSSIDNGMILMNVSTYWQYVVKGLILLLAVIIDIRTKKT